MESSTNRDRYHHGYLKQTLIEKGIDYIRKYGVETMSFRKLATMCNVSHAAPYKHFKDKEDFVAQINSYVVDKFSKILLDIIHKYKDSPELMIELGVGYVDFFAKNPNYFFIMFTGGEINFDFVFSTAGSTENSFPPYKIYKDAVIGFMNRMNIPPEENEDQILFMWALVQGIASIFTLQGIQYSEEQKEAIRKVLKVKICFYVNDNLVIG